MNDQKEEVRRGSIPPEKQVRWGAAVLAGLIVGFVFLFVAHGIPWVASGVIRPTVMGRELVSPATVDFNVRAGVVGLHMVFAVLYALLLAPAISRMNAGAAILTGALFGVLFYLINFAVFQLALSQGTEQSEMTPLLTHVAFGLILAGAYKGLAKPRPASAGDGYQEHARQM